MTSIGNFVFRNCTGLESASVPSGITKLSEQMFQGCSSLSTLYLPASITYVSQWATHDCFALTDVYFAGSAWQWQTMKREIFGNHYLNAVATIHTDYVPEAEA